MTQGIRNFLNLPSPPSDDDHDNVEIDDNERAIADLEALQKMIGEPAEDVGAAHHGAAMDKDREEIHQHAVDLMELGFNMDTPRARGIFEVAASFYKMNMEAAIAKRDAELKRIKLDLDRRKLELEEKKFKISAGEALDTDNAVTVVYEDRNAVLRRIKEDRDSEKE